MRRWPLLLLILAAACSSHSTPPVAAAGHTTGPMLVNENSPPPPPDPTTRVERSGFAHDESFCAPRHGRITYDVTGRTATLELAAHSLPAARDLAINWHNAHSPRGYVIASFRTDRAGAPRHRTLRMFRGGETRGSRLILTTGSDRVVATLRPC